MTGPAAFEPAATNLRLQTNVRVGLDRRLIRLATANAVCLPGWNENGRYAEGGYDSRSFAGRLYGISPAVRR